MSAALTASPPPTPIPCTWAALQDICRSKGVVEHKGRGRREDDDDDTDDPAHIIIEYHVPPSKVRAVRDRQEELCRALR